MSAPLVLAPGDVAVEVVRNGVVEGLHHAHAVVLGLAGEIVAELGRPAQPVLPRSSNKPLQAVGLLRAGLDLPPRQLALAAASHAGTPEHVAGVRELLAAHDLDESQLRCPPDLPLDDAARAAVIAGGGRAEPILMNCSGKHAAMLAACRVRGWPTDSYLDPDHPLQRFIAATVEDLAGPVAAVAVDGCGAPLFAVSLIGVARAFGVLVEDPDGAPRRVADAMRAHPDLVSGAGRPATVLMRGVPGLLAKDGAEGVWGAAAPGLGAIAVKVDDGAARAADRVAVAALRRLGLDAAVLDELAEAPVSGGGPTVGVIRTRAGVLG